MLQLIFQPSQIVTVDTKGKHVKHGKKLSDIGVLTDHSIIVENETIKDIIPNSSVNKGKFDKVTDVQNKTIFPGFVECHTHTAFAGTRADEFRERIRGISYEQIAKKGGGIKRTVEAVRACSFDQLIELMKPRVDHFISQGVTSLEIKSGYGLSYYDEIKILQSITHLNEVYTIDIIPTFLGAHTFPKEYKNDHSKYMNILIDELLPYVAENKLAKFCDAFCEITAFSAEQVNKLFDAASKLKMGLKLHTEQFNNIGGLDTALEYKAASVDHLEVLKEEQIENLSKSKTAAVLLPGVSYFLEYDYAPARQLIDNNSIVALATDYNPGSSNISNIGLIMSLAAHNMDMTIEEIISAYTINAAYALGIEKEVGSIEIGKKADFAIIDKPEFSEIVYQTAFNLNVITIKNGEIIYQK